MGLVPSERGSWTGGVLLANTYLLGREISRGGMGEVFEATHARLPGRYAVKILLPELTGHREAFARFCREAEVMSELRHPNVVQIFDFNTTPDGRPYFVMEYLEGRDLETRLTDAGPLPLPFAVRIVDSVASALAAAHSHGIVHRDLKPANIFLVTVDGQPDELVKVLDFGISKVRAAGTLLSTPSDVLGTPPYMSPEQARGATHLIDGRTDQFALGAITYRMLTGRDPFTGNDIASLLYQVVHQAPPPLARHVPSSWDTRALQAVLDKAMAKEPAQRWTGMLEFARAFEAASEQTLSRLPPEGESFDLSTTLIAAPPPPPAATPERTPLTPTPVVHPTPLVRAVTPAPLVRPVTPAPIVMGSEPTAPALITDEPPPVRTPAPVLTDPAPAVAAPLPGPAALPAVVARPAPHPNPAVVPAAAAPIREYDWEPTGTVDDVPRHRGGLAVIGVLLGGAAVVLAVTGAYRRIPAGLSSVVQAVRGRPAPVVAPAPAPPAPGATEPVPAQPGPAAAAPAEARPPAEPSRSAEDRAVGKAPERDRTSADRPPQKPQPRSARQSDEKAAEERPPRERAHRTRSGGVHYLDHPGSIDLSGRPDRSTNPFLVAPSAPPPSAVPPPDSTPSPAAPRAASPDSPPPSSAAPADAPASAAPASAAPSSTGFGIAPPAPTTDTPAHDIAPAPGPDTAEPDRDRPLPPSVH